MARRGQAAKRRRLGLLFRESIETISIQGYTIFLVDVGGHHTLGIMGPRTALDLLVLAVCVGVLLIAHE